MTWELAEEVAILPTDAVGVGVFGGMSEWIEDSEERYVDGVGVREWSDAVEGEGDLGQTG